MTLFLFCDFSGLASLQLMQMNGVRWLLLLDRRFLALPLTRSFETDSSSVSQNTQLIQSHTRTPDCDDQPIVLMHCPPLHITSSTESPQLARQCRFVCVALQSFLSTISPHACPSVLQASPRALTETHHHARISVSPNGWQSDQGDLRTRGRLGAYLVGLRDRRFSFRCPAFSANEMISRVESSLAHKRSCCCAPHLLQISPA